MRMGFALLGLIVATTAAALPPPSKLSSYAFVNDDGSLRIDRRTIHLYGIYIPPTARTCEDQVRPARCGPRAALALEFKVSSHFVHCTVYGAQQDGSLVGYCEADGEDLAAYLLQRGWAAALPDAPPEYAILERIARQHGLGVWGASVDRIVR
ncbi:MAG: thermonuclease family protein [Gammaproteobacteria bacterium]|nr:thermonuclease family protein [Gammaproteobacteria bacterium]MCP5424267.1 thermonuclease family protein [Gammaproteobacteria bacterium]